MSEQTSIGYYASTEYFGEWFVIENDQKHYQAIVPADSEQDTQARDLATLIKSAMDGALVGKVRRIEWQVGRFGFVDGRVRGTRLFSYGPNIRHGKPYRLNTTLPEQEHLFWEFDDPAECTAKAAWLLSMYVLDLVDTE